MLSKCDCYLEEVEGHEVETVVSVPEELQETVNPCHVNAIATSMLGLSQPVEMAQARPSIIVKFSFVVVFVVAESYDDDK